MYGAPCMHVCHRYATVQAKVDSTLAARERTRLGHWQRCDGFLLLQEATHPAAPPNKGEGGEGRPAAGEAPSSSSIASQHDSDPPARVPLRMGTSYGRPFLGLEELRRRGVHGLGPQGPGRPVTPRGSRWGGAPVAEGDS